MSPRSPAAASSRDQRRRVLLDLFREVGGDRERVAARLGLDGAALDARIRQLGLLRQIGALPAAGERPAGVQVRKSGEKPVRVRPSAPIPPPLPKRGAGRPPRGRLTLGASAERDRRELTSEKGRELVRQLIAAHRGHAPTLLRRLNDLYGAKGRPPLTAADLEEVLERHQLTAEAEAASDQRLLMLVQQHRGDLQRLGKALKLSRTELAQELKRRGLTEVVERARDRFRREVFARPRGEQVFLLLNRRSSLSDLGALEALEKELGEVARAAWVKAAEAEPGERLKRLGALLAISEERASGLVRHFALR